MNQDLEVDGVNLEVSKKSKEAKIFDPEEFIYKYRFTLTLLLLGLILIGFGVIYFKNVPKNQEPEIEILNASLESSSSEIIVEISGEVEKPGVYKLPSGSRLEDILIASGGISANADRGWVEKYINRAAKLVDGQKIYIPSFESGENERSRASTAKNEGGSKVFRSDRGSGGLNSVNINTASQSQLEDLPGIGPVYAQSIIEHRPYSSVEELLTRTVLKKNVYEKVKNDISVY